MGTQTHTETDADTQTHRETCNKTTKHTDTHKHRNVHINRYTHKHRPIDTVFLEYKVNMACTLSYCFCSATWSTTVHTGFMFLTICANCYWQTIGLDSIEASLTPYSVTSLAAGPVLVTIWSTVADLAAKTCPPAISIHSLQKYFYSLVRTYLFIVQNKFANQSRFLLISKYGRSCRKEKSHSQLSMMVSRDLAK